MPPMCGVGITRVISTSRSWPGTTSISRPGFAKFWNTSDMHLSTCSASPSRDTTLSLPPGRVFSVTCNFAPELFLTDLIVLPDLPMSKPANDWTPRIQARLSQNQRASACPALARSLQLVQQQQNPARSRAADCNSATVAWTCERRDICNPPQRLPRYFAGLITFLLTCARHWKKSLSLLAYLARGEQEAGDLRHALGYDVGGAADVGGSLGFLGEIVALLNVDSNASLLSDGLDVLTTLPDDGTHVVGHESQLDGFFLVVFLVPPKFRKMEDNVLCARVDLLQTPGDRHHPLATTRPHALVNLESGTRLLSQGDDCLPTFSNEHPRLLIADLENESSLWNLQRVS
eukprot:CAMPEP_0194533356 /NCGR_PEP_ID=MMETSP0253-20130528/71221_1 /TAXON_ID=2966 /ORGANISM="Noctiluca scintillans" /LENGTH=345 /DNA_ID=CAMNT_0039378899 /DNA_START=280 /DNA_END=1319 /DNA_ORIENTATION=+